MATTTAPAATPTAIDLTARSDIALMAVDNPGRDATPAVARFTGLAYLSFLIVGALGLVVIRGTLFVSGDAAKTAANLIEREGLARFGIAAALGAALTQAVVALSFFALFRRVHGFAAGAVAAFGLLGAAALLFAAVFAATALDVALDANATSVQHAYLLSRLQGSAWTAGGVFFGLWLLPLGWLVLRSAVMPRPLGWLLLVGGVGYVLNAFLSVLAPNAKGVADALLVPSTVGELWMIGYLLRKRMTNGPTKSDLGPSSNAA